MSYLSSINELSAAEGFPLVILGALQAFGALALIVGVLVVMDKVYKKKHSESTNEKENSTSNCEDNAGENI